MRVQVVNVYAVVTVRTLLRKQFDQFSVDARLYLALLRNEAVVSEVAT